MRTHRKIQLTAAVVAANAIVALQLLSPEIANAAACTPGGGVFCDYTQACLGGDAIAACTALAPAGCTSIQGVCIDGALCDLVLPAVRVLCQWQ